MNTRSALTALITLLTATMGCSSDDEDTAGSGTATITTYGEDFIEDHIPADEVEDGWNIEFDRFLIVISNVAIEDAHRNGGFSLSDSKLFDMTTPGPHTIVKTKKLTAGSWNEFGFEIRPATEQTARHKSATDNDLDMMVENGYSVFVAGSATKDDVTKTFEWGFTHTTEYHKCVEVDASGDEVRHGLQITNGGETEVQLTIHGDHFFYDDLTAENAVLRFDSLAAADDADNPDGEITLDELDALHLVDIDEGTYGTGSYSDVNTLGDFVTALTSTLGHFQGEGHCHSQTQ